MKKAIFIQLLSLVLVLPFTSCQQQDSSIVSPDLQEQLNKKPEKPPIPDPEPEPVLIYNVVFIDNSAEFNGLDAPGCPAQTDGTFFNANWTDPCIEIPVNGTTTVLRGLPYLNVAAKKGNITEFTIWVQDEIGGIMHSTEPYPLSVPISDTGFDLVIDREIDLYRHSNSKGGKKTYHGTVSIGTISYTAVP